MKEDTIKSFAHGTVFLVIFTAVFCGGMLFGVAIGAMSLVANAPDQACDAKSK